MFSVNKKYMIIFALSSSFAVSSFAHDNEGYKCGEDAVKLFVEGATRFGEGKLYESAKSLNVKGKELQKRIAAGTNVIPLPKDFIMSSFKGFLKEFKSKRVTDLARKVAVTPGQAAIIKEIYAFIIAEMEEYVQYDFDTALYKSQSHKARYLAFAQKLEKMAEKEMPQIWALMKEQGMNQTPATEKEALNCGTACIAWLHDLILSLGQGTTCVQLNSLAERFVTLANFFRRTSFNDDKDYRNTITRAYCRGALSHLQTINFDEFVQNAHMTVHQGNYIKELVKLAEQSLSKVIQSNKPAMEFATAFNPLVLKVYLTQALGSL